MLSVADPLQPDEPDAAAFESQMRWVKASFNVLPLDVAVAALREGNLPARSLCITFDDGYADNRSIAVPILQRLQLHSTFFVATGFLDGGRMWNDTVIEAIRRAEPDRLDLSDLGLGTYDITFMAGRVAAIEDVIGKLKYKPPSQRSAHADAIADRVGANLPDDLMLNSAQVCEIRDAGMSIGAHTVDHPILACLSDAAARRQIVESKRALEELLRDPVGLFAYPNGEPGRDFTRRHVDMVRELGFDAAVTTACGAAVPGCDPHQIPRFTPWDRSEFRFNLRLARNTRVVDYALV
ncbi:MAG: polysaccharide deacetylase family protein [Burkholderiales bacterium]|nr:polysaccharide deacetylase family protein [Burkholderiales bacterium]